MSNPIEEFDRILKELSTIKAPGVSGSRIKTLKDLFLSNVDEEEKLTSTLINGCKETNPSNKLGPLYVVDATVRGLIEEMGKSGSVEINSDSPNGTAAAAVYKISNSIEDIVDDAISVSNDDIKERIGKLIDIWENSATFKKETLKSIKDKYFASNTPPGTPPKKKVKFALDESTTIPNSTDSNSSNNVEISSSNISSSSDAAPVPSQILDQHESSSNPPSKDPTSVLQALANLAKKTPSPNVTANTNLAPKNNNSSNYTSPPNNNSVSTSAGSDPNAIFQLLQNMNKMSNNNDQNQNQSQNQNQNQNQNQRSGPGSNFGHGANSIPLGDSSNNYREREGRGRGNDNGFGRKRERSPKRGQDPKPTHVEGEQNEPSNPHFRPKTPRVDNSLPSGTIGVMSRTIFIGGVPHSMDERQLTQTLRPYAEVQSVILNGERKHAFVKVYSRNEAEQVIQAFSVSHPSGLRARWGVGFGPRDCCNYQTGVSTIPIARLTDADKKWLVQAQWGGAADLPLQSGLFVEEPDIEVGHGVSSKSISRKMPTNSSSNGPKSDGLPVQVNKYGQNNNNNNNRYNNNNHNNPGNIPVNFGNYGAPQIQSPPQQYQQSPIPQYQQPPMQSYQQPMPPQQQSPIPQFNNSQVDPSQAQMMATMMSAMQQAQQNGGNGVDMSSMFQNMANMFKNNQQPQ